MSWAFIVTHNALHHYAKKSPEKKYHPLSLLLETVILNQRLFSFCQSCTDSTSRSAKVESKRCSRCMNPLSRFFVALDNVYNLAVSFNFAITNGQINSERRKITQQWMCHTLHSLRKGHWSSQWCAQIWIFIISDNDIKLSNEMDRRGGGGGVRWGGVASDYCLFHGCAKGLFCIKLCEDFITSPEAQFPLPAIAAYHTPDQFQHTVRADFRA